MRPLEVTRQASPGLFFAGYITAASGRACPCFRAAQMALPNGNPHSSGWLIFRQIESVAT
jgi:hypothetical protein